MLFVTEQVRDSMRAQRRKAESRAILKSAGLRPTRQRLAIADALFCGFAQHVTADTVFQNVSIADEKLSLATVYNALNQFADVGLLRRIAVNGERTYFDTDPGDHHHFYVEAEDRIVDIPTGAVGFGSLPAPPPGYEIVHIDVVIRLRCSAAQIDPVGRPARPGADAMKLTPSIIFIESVL